MNRTRTLKGQHLIRHPLSWLKLASQELRSDPEFMPKVASQDAGLMQLFAAARSTGGAAAAWTMSPKARTNDQST